MSILSLGYIGLGGADIAGWRLFAADILGVEAKGDGEGGLVLRYDDKIWRIGISPGEPDLQHLGWEVAGPEALAALVGRLQAAGVAVETGSPDLMARRGVQGLAAFVDPAGVRCELYWGAREAGPDESFVSPHAVSGFVTGEQGLGHLAVNTAAPEAAIAFYRDVLGFRLSDVIDLRMGPDLVVPITFLHCNPRHHSIAFARAPSPRRLIHLMIEAEAIEDVARAYDRVHAAGVPVSITLGRHTNDHMFSFYCLSPDGLEIEFGADSRVIDDNTWTPGRYDSISLWGHQFQGPPPGAPTA